MGYYNNLKIIAKQGLFILFVLKEDRLSLSSPLKMSNNYNNYPNNNFQGNESKNWNAPINNGGARAGGSFSHKAPISALDLRCYFDCPEGFKKDHDLRLHVKLRHRNEDPDELRRAFQAAEEEIALVSRSGCKFQCAICPKQFTSDSSFYDHTQKLHNVSRVQYKERYGTGEVESSSFECKLCGNVLKFVPNNVHRHLKEVHGLNWPKYVERIRKMRRGERPEELPQISHFQCQICNVTVKGLKDHVWSVHRLSQPEYQDRINKMNRGIDPGELPSIETFECKVCHASVKYLREHLKSTHKIT